MNESRFESILLHFDDLRTQLSDPAVFGNMEKFRKLSKEFKDLEKVVEAIEDYRKTKSNLESCLSLIRTENDKDLVEMAKEELSVLEEKLPEIEKNLRYLLLPKDPEDHKNAVLEIRAGTGGDEASLFAGDLFRMYSRYAETHGFAMEVVDFNEGNTGGFKEIICNITGPDAYGTFKFEAGVHRVQRVPATETQGRIHTSAATVMVMPEAEEFDVEIKKEDLKIETMCASGPGGQSVNTTYSAVRLTHIPTGVTAQCQDQKSQLKNMDKAMNVLRSRLYEIELQKRMEAEGAFRKSMVSSGDRSNKIRTYNFPQSRITDHRIGLTLYNLESVINGDLHPLIEALQLHENTAKMESSAS
jgi:peptide chain release factor 1